MPITQPRIVELIHACRHFYDKSRAQRAAMEQVYRQASNANDYLEESNLNEQQREALAILFESLNTIRLAIGDLTTKDMTAQETLVREEQHFSQSRQRRNEKHARYLRRRKANLDSMREYIEENNIPAEPKLTRRLSRPAQDRMEELKAIAYKGYKIDKDSWSTDEILNWLSISLRRDSCSDVLEELVDTKLVHRYPSGNYEFNLPDWEQQAETADD